METICPLKKHTFGLICWIFSGWLNRRQKAIFIAFQIWKGVVILKCCSSLLINLSKLLQGILCVSRDLGKHWKDGWSNFHDKIVAGRQDWWKKCHPDADRPIEWASEAKPSISRHLLGRSNRVYGVKSVKVSTKDLKRINWNNSPTTSLEPVELAETKVLEAPDRHQELNDSREQP